MVKAADLPPKERNGLRIGDRVASKYGNFGEVLTFLAEPHVLVLWDYCKYDPEPANQADLTRIAKLAVKFKVTACKKGGYLASPKTTVVPPFKMWGPTRKDAIELAADIVNEYALFLAKD